jgi:hypothetical protein
MSLHPWTWNDPGHAQPRFILPVRGASFHARIAVRRPPPLALQLELAVFSALDVMDDRVPELRETFYAITPSRRFPHPIVDELVGANDQLLRP